MTSACTFPALDEEVTLADGKTKGYYPATMSPKIVGELLRGELGFEGVVMTDALEMDQFFDEPETGDAILPGGRELEGYVNVAERCIVAGCDILLIPTDLDSKDKVQWYEDYIAGLAEKVASGVIPETLVDDAVRRILSLKELRGVLDLDTCNDDLSDALEQAQASVGSAQHHDVERAIAEQAVTLLKDDGVLPVPGKDANAAGARQGREHRDPGTHRCRCHAHKLRTRGTCGLGHHRPRRARGERYCRRDGGC